MMRKSGLGAGLIISLALNIGVLGSAGYNRVKSCREAACLPSRTGNVSLAPAAALDLSSSQAKKMETLRQGLEMKLKDLRSGLSAEQVKLVSLLRQSQEDRDAIRAQAAKIQDLQSKIQEIVIDQLLAEKALLTAGQRECFFGALSERLCPMGKHDMEFILTGTGEKDVPCPEKKK